MSSKTTIENEIKRRVRKEFVGILVAWVIVGGCNSMLGLNSPTASQSHLGITAELEILTGILGGLFYGVFVGLPTAFSMAILERWMLRGYKVRAFQISWAIMMLIVFLVSNNDIGWIAYVLILVFYGLFIATLVFNNRMKKRYADDLKKHKAPKSLVLQEEEEAKKINKSSKAEPTDESDDDLEDML